MPVDTKQLSHERPESGESRHAAAALRDGGGAQSSAPGSIMSTVTDFHLPVAAFPPGGDLWTDADVTVELERCVPTGSASQEMWILGDDSGHAVGALENVPSVESVETLDRLPDRVLVRVHWTRLEFPVVDIAAECDATVVEAVGTAEGWTVAGRFPDEDALATFYEACSRRGIVLDIHDLHGRDHETDDSYGMSPVQRETIEAAFEMGYFDVPRRTTIAAIAERLGVSEQAISERLRRGLATYLTETLVSDAVETNAERSSE